MLDRVREIVGSQEVTAYERVAIYEDRDQIETERCYTEALYHGEDGYFLVVENNLFAISQQAAFSWLNRRGFYEIMLAIYSEIEGTEIGLPEGDYLNELVQSEKIGKP
ncbi:hypothetical protein [Agrobacterium rosae]|uniref:Immunity protein 35 domain-containing protein n=1 Tax=Agrobacterium rosae TaxID=1972867 RepID=A0AAW9FKB8_9HYPH|nr:hypothetical protein [Agrobacterium rosae]MDX8305869.1 hypothetical protein [Agrobacterium rosae]